MTQAFPELGFMVLGGHVPDPTPIRTEVPAGERLGFGSVWISERPGTKDIGVLSGIATALAPKLAVGSGLIANLPLRNPLMVASYASTMMLMTGERFVLGVGHCQDRFADAAGVPRSTRALIGRYIEVLRRLWRGEVVTARGDNWALENAALGVRLRQLPRVFMAAVGDRSLAWAGRHCDGVILFSCLNPRAVAHSVAVVRQAAEAAGRDPREVEVWGVAVTACEVPEEKFLNYVVRRMNTYFMLPMIDALIRVNEWNARTAGAIRQAVLEQASNAKGAIGDEGVSREMDDLRRFRDLYPASWLDECNATGSADNAARYMRALFDAGADRVLIHGSPPSDLGPFAAAWPAHRPAER